MRVTVTTTVSMTVVLGQYKDDDTVTIAQAKADMANQIKDHVSKMLRPDRDDDIQVQATVDDVRVVKAELL
jgi:hypothetical protein